MAKTKLDLRKIIREEIISVLKEDENDGFVELIVMDPNFDEGWKLIEKAWNDWKLGPATQPQMIGPAKNDLVKYIIRLLKQLN